MAEYVMKNITKNWLEKHGFHQHTLFSSEEETIYTYRFPVFKYRGIPTLEGEVMVCLETGEAKIDIFEKGTRNRYASWYCEKMGFGQPNKVVDAIKKVVEKKIKDLKIEETKENEK